MYTRVPNCMMAALERFFSFTFHDAQLYSLRIDFGSRTATLDVACMHRQCGADGTVLFEEYRRGRLVLSGLEYFCFDRGEEMEMELFDSPETISEFLAEDFDSISPVMNGQQVPEGVTAYRLYFFGWNSFLHLGVREAEFAWTESPHITSWHVLEVITRLRMRLADAALPARGADPTWSG